MSISAYSPAPGARAAAGVLQEQLRLIDSTAPVRRMLDTAPVAAMLLNPQTQIVAADHGHIVARQHDGGNRPHLPVRPLIAR